MASINLAEFVKDNQFDTKLFEQTVIDAVYAMNEVLDEGLPLHPLQEQKDSVSDWRQIGLGIFGLADMLIKMGITYGSEEAIKLCDEIGFTMANTAIMASSALAKDFGTYPMYNRDSIIESPYYAENIAADTMHHVYMHGLHNSQLLTIAPTGSLSTMLGVSGGIEPVFANYYERKTESLHGEDKYYKVYTPIVKNYMDTHGITDDTDLPEFFVTAQNLDYNNRIKMQAIWQKHIDASISSTVNLPEETTVDDVVNLYTEAWRNGLKGVTIFRSGCKRAGILTTGSSKADEETHEEEQTSTPSLGRGDIIKVNDDVVGKKRTLHTGCGTLHCEAFFDPYTGDLLETYLSKGSTGGCNSFMVGLSRMMSLSARGGVSVHDIVDQLKSAPTCPSYAVRAATKRDTSPGSSCPAAVGNAILDMHREMMSEIEAIEADYAEDYTSDKFYTPTKNTVVEIKKSASGTGVCPECGGDLAFEGGCNTCKSCGWSRCD